jgi:hypothetical protein
VGVDSEDFEQIEFEPGRAELQPPEREKLAKLSEALTLRPNIILTVPGAYHAAEDTAELKAMRIDQRIEAYLAALPQAADQTKPTMLEQRRRTALEALHRSARPEIDLKTMRSGFQVPVDPQRPDGKSRLDAPAYAAALRRDLMENEPITQTDLETLGDSRADAVREMLMQDTDAGLAGRLMLTPAQEARINKRQLIALTLDISSN